jgi:adenosine kinase
MNHAHVQTVPTDGSVTLGLISPDGRDGMINAAQFAAAKIPFIFDRPGLPMFGGEELLRLSIRPGSLNEYEGQLLSDRTGLSHEELAKRVDALIVTHGAQGSVIYTKGDQLHIPSAKPAAVNDPTGCGDAYRAGLIYGLMNQLGWEVTGRIASLIGAIKIASHGPQNHRFAREEFAAQYQLAFGQTLSW